MILHTQSRSLAHDPSRTETRFGTPDTPRTNQLLIEAGRIERQYWRDLWRYRELFYFLAWRDLLVRYKQTVVGVSWSLIRPLLTTIVLTVVFGKLGKMPSGGVPYPLLVLCGMLPWQFFSTAMTESGNSLVMNSNLISKIYFPRLIIIVSSVITSFVDFLISGCFPRYPDDLVSLPASCSCITCAIVRAAGVRCLARGRSVDRRADGRISRFPFHCPIHRPIWPLYFSSRFPE